MICRQKVANPLDAPTSRGDVSQETRAALFQGWLRKGSGGAARTAQSPLRLSALDFEKIEATPSCGLTALASPARN
jgi:hypothetical protein